MPPGSKKRKANKKKHKHNNNHNPNSDHPPLYLQENGSTDEDLEVMASRPVAVVEDPVREKEAKIVPLMEVEKSDVSEEFISDVVEKFDVLIEEHIQQVKDTLNENILDEFAEERSVDFTENPDKVMLKTSVSEESVAVAVASVTESYKDEFTEVSSLGFAEHPENLVMEKTGTSKENVDSIIESYKDEVAEESALGLSENPERVVMEKTGVSEEIVACDTGNCKDMVEERESTGLQQVVDCTEGMNLDDFAEKSSIGFAGKPDKLVCEEFVPQCTRNHVAQSSLREDFLEEKGSDELGDSSLLSFTEKSDLSEEHVLDVIDNQEVLDVKKPHQVDICLKEKNLDELADESLVGDTENHDVLVQSVNTAIENLKQNLTVIIDSSPEKEDKVMVAPDIARTEISPRNEEVACGPLVVRRATFWSFCGLFDVLSCTGK